MQRENKSHHNPDLNIRTYTSVKWDWVILIEYSAWAAMDIMRYFINGSFYIMHIAMRFDSLAWRPRVPSLDIESAKVLYAANTESVTQHCIPHIECQQKKGMLTVAWLSGCAQNWLPSSLDQFSASSPIRYPAAGSFLSQGSSAIYLRGLPSIASCSAWWAQMVEPAYGEALPPVYSCELASSAQLRQYN